MRSAARGLTLALFLSCAFEGALAQQSTISSRYFAEPSQLFSSVPRDTLLFEAQIFAHFYFYDGFRTRSDQVYSRPVTTWAWQFTPIVRLRMLTSDSNPIRPPSFMPRPLHFQFFRVALADTTLRDNARQLSPIRIWSADFIPWAHHSNGQEGCLYAYQSDNTCTGIRPPIDPPVANFTNGSFSTNYARLGIGYQSIRTTTGPSGYRLGDRICALDLVVESNPYGWGPGAIQPEQAEFYPKRRLIGALNLSKLNGPSTHWSAGRSSAALEFQLLDNTAPDVSPWIASLELRRTFERSGWWGIFVRLYSGMDYYNLRYLKERSAIHFGISLDHVQPQEFRLPQTSTANPSLPPAASAYGNLNWLDRQGAPIDKLCGWLGNGLFW